MIPVQGPEAGEDRSGAPDLFDAATRRRLSAPGLRTFLNIADRLELRVAERRRLLGGIAPSTYHHWRSRPPSELSADTLTRISLVLGIFKGLRLLFADDATMARWLRGANTDPPFGGRSPLETLVAGPLDTLFAMRRYIDAWRGVWP